jgi:anti-sigma factor (TIGR02949 family)
MSATPDRLTCEEVFRRLDDFLDRALAGDELRLVREHLETCAVCTAEYRFEESLVSEVRGKLERIELPSGLMERIASKLAAAEDDPEA